MSRHLKQYLFTDGLLLAGWLIVRHSSCFQFRTLVTQGSCQSTHLRLALLFFIPDGLLGEVLGLENVEFTGSVDLRLRKDRLLLFCCSSTLREAGSRKPVSKAAGLRRALPVPRTWESTLPPLPLLLVLPPHKGRQTGQLVTHRNSFLVLLAAGSLRAGCQCGQVPVRVCLPVSSQVGKEQALWSPFYKGTNPTQRAPPL